jgi:hypothetical protein
MIKITRRPIGASARGLVFEYRADGFEPVDAMDIYAACRRLREQGASGDVEVFTTGGTLTIRSTVERLAQQQVLEADRDGLSVRRYAPHFKQATAPVREDDLVASRGQPVSAIEGPEPPLQAPEGWSLQIDARTFITADHSQWIITIGRQRHFCSTKAGFRRWLAAFPEVIDQFPEHFKQWKPPATKDMEIGVEFPEARNWFVPT